MKNSRRTTVNCNGKEQEKLRVQFPFLYDLEWGETISGMNKKALSVFDHWLTEEEALNQIEGASEKEFAYRNDMHREFNQYLVENFICLKYKFIGKKKRNITFKKFVDLPTAKYYVEPSDGRLPNKNKFSIVVPDANVIYFEGSDSTNYLYSKEIDSMEEMKKKAKSIGLFCLDL